LLYPPGETLSPMEPADGELFKYRLQGGYIFLHRRPSLVATVLGSGVAVAMWDKALLYGGMANYLYPVTKNPAEASTRFGNVAIRYLFKLMIAEGSKRENIQAQIFGGATSNDASCREMAEENIKIADELLARLEIEVVSRDVGGQMGRKVVLNTLKNEAVVYKVERIRMSDWYPYEGREDR